MPKPKRGITNRDLYKSYTVRCKKDNTKPLSFTKWRIVIEAMGTVFSEHLYQKGIVGLPRKKGDVMINRYISKHPRWLAKYPNDHSDKLSYKVFWLSPFRKMKQGNIWLFGTERTLRRRIRKRIESGHSYPDYTKLLKIS